MTDAGLLPATATAGRHPATDPERGTGGLPRRALQPAVPHGQPRLRSWSAHRRVCVPPQTPSPPGLRRAHSLGAHRRGGAGRGRHGARERGTAPARTRAHTRSQAGTRARLREHGCGHVRSRARDRARARKRAHAPVRKRAHARARRAHTQACSRTAKRTRPCSHLRASAPRIQTHYRTHARARKHPHSRAQDHADGHAHALACACARATRETRLRLRTHRRHTGTRVTCPQCLSDRAPSVTKGWRRAELGRIMRRRKELPGQPRGRDREESGPRRAGAGIESDPRGRAQTRAGARTAARSGRGAEG